MRSFHKHPRAQESSWYLFPVLCIVLLPAMSVAHTSRPKSSLDTHFDNTVVRNVLAKISVLPRLWVEFRFQTYLYHVDTGQASHSLNSNGSETLSVELQKRQDEWRAPIPYCPLPPKKLLTQRRAV